MPNKAENKDEVFKVSGDDIVKKVKEIIKKGNATRIIIKNEKGKTIMEMPVTVGVIGTALAPALAALGALAALLTECTIVVEKKL